jgi:hypothetical protein
MGFPYIAGRWSVIDEPTPNTRKWCKGYIRDMFIAALIDIFSTLLLFSSLDG